MGKQAQTIETHGHKIEIKVSGVLPPDSKSNMNTGCKTWYKYDNYKWFQPYGNFNQRQVIKMIGICENEYQLNSLMELLSATKQEEE